MSSAPLRRSRRDYTDASKRSLIVSIQTGGHVQPTVTITLERSGAWRGAAGSGKRRHTRGEPGPLTRPVRLLTHSGSVLARPRRLPLGDASITSITCLDVLEYIRNDDLAVDEFARVLA